MAIIAKAEIKDSDIKRFWEKVDRSAGDDGCWLWTAGKKRKGYGVFSLKSKDRTAHRVSWAIHTGSIPDDLHCLHRCDCPPCVNPAHLFLGTNADNVADKTAKNRQVKGESSTKAKLTEKQVIEIRLNAGKSTAVELAKQYGVTSAVIRKVITRDTWKHVGIDIPVVMYKTDRLSESQVRDIRIAAKTLPTKDLVKKFNIPYGTMQDIISKRSHKDIV